MATNNSTNNTVPDAVTMDLELLATRLWLSGGGTLSVDSNFNVRWSNRLIAISQGRASDGIVGGYIGILSPAAGSTIVGEGGATSKTVVANGIPLTSWDALYFIWQPAVSQQATSAATNFRVVNYTADFSVPANWILLAQRNGDTGLVRFATGHYLGAGQTLAANNRAPSGSVQNADLAPAAGSTFKGNPSASSASPQDLTGQQATALLSEMAGATALAGGAKGLVPAPSAGDDSRVLLGGGVWGCEVLFGSVSWSERTVAANSATGLLPLQVPGAKAEGVAILCPAGLPAGIVIQVSRINAGSTVPTVDYRLLNVTGIAITIAAQTCRAVVIQQ